MAQTSPNDADLRWPLTFLVGFVFLCAQVVIFSIWNLLTLVQKELIFTNISLVWFNRILISMAAASLVPIGFLTFLLFQGEDPGLPMVLITLLSGLAVLYLITFVLKTRTQKVIYLLNN